MAEQEAPGQQEQEGEGQATPNGGGSSRLSGLLNKDVLIPIAATAATAAAAGFAAKKAPDVKNKLTGEAKEGAQELGRQGAEGAKDSVKQSLSDSPLGALAEGVSKIVPGMGKGKGGSKKTRRLPIQRWTDVAVPVEEAFARWRKFDDFPKFMHRVQKAEEKDDGTVEWEEKIWFSRRQWRGEITDLRENDRIAWKTVSGTSHTGIVSFHRLDDNLTRVLVTVDFQPAGMIEKMGSGLRFAKRAVQADLARFKAWTELGEAEGVEYEAAPKQDEKDEKDEQDERKEDAKGDAGEAQSRGGDDSGASDDGASASNGGGPEEREERERRRRERREALKSR